MSGEGVAPRAGRTVVDPPPGESAAVLSDAFAAEPGMRWLCRSDGERRAWFRSTERLLARQAGASRYLVHLGREAAAAAWVSRAHSSAPPLGAQVRWIGEALRGCGPRTLVRAARYRVREVPFVPQRTAVLEFIGVRPAYQGSGVGGALLRRVMADVATHDWALHLTTADPRNVQIYDHFGFVQDGSFEVGGLRVVAMSRGSSSADRRARRHHS